MIQLYYLRIGASTRTTRSHNLAS